MRRFLLGPPQTLCYQPRLLIWPDRVVSTLLENFKLGASASSLKDEKQKDFGYKAQETRHGGCSSVVEHWIVAPVVAGSIPVIHPIQSEEEERLR
jgi:hypothetical protein